MNTSRDKKYLQFDSSGIGYIIIPFDVEREEYIKTCYARERVCILIEQGSNMVKDCYISKSAIKDIYFPEPSSEDKVQTGSAVVWVTDSFNNKPIIVAVLSKEDESDLLSQYRFKLRKDSGKRSVLIEGDAEEGILDISVFDSEDYGVINIKVSGSSDAELNVKSQGKVNILGSQLVSVESVGKTQINIKNSQNGEVLSSIEVNGQDIVLKPQNEVKIGDFTEPVALADSLADILNELITKVSQATVSTMLGMQPLLNATEIAAIANRLDEIKSKVTKTS